MKATYNSHIFSKRLIILKQDLNTKQSAFQSIHIKTLSLMGNVIVSRCWCLRDKQYFKTLKTKAVNIIKTLTKKLTLLGLSRKSADRVQC